MSAPPAGWVEANIDDLRASVPNAITDGPYGSNLKTSDYRSDGPRVVRLGNIGYRAFLDSDIACISKKHFQGLARHHIESGDVLVAALGDPIGRACLAPPNLGPALVKADCFRVRVSSQVSAEFLMLWLNSDCARTAFSKSAHGMGRIRINLSDLRRTVMSVPPAAEQRRIVAKIHNLSSTSARSRDHVDHIPRLVEKYRQAVLAAEFKKYSGKKAPTTLGECSEFVTSGSRGWAKFYSAGGARFIRVGNVRRANVNLDWNDTQRVAPPPGSEGQRTSVRPNDLVVTITADLGRVGLIPADIGPAYVNQHVSLIRLKSPKNAAFLAWYLASDAGQEQLLAGNRGATRAGLGLDDIKAVRVPVPSQTDQMTTIKRIQTALAWIDRIALENTNARKLIDHLDQAILAKAFQGELLPQDPSDEPASVLLERIRTERAAEAATRSSKRTWSGKR